jgi:6-phosphofructokinase 2
MILTLTVNPALDVYSRVEKMNPNDKLRCEKAKTDAGGGGINVTRVIKRLGGNSTAIYTKGGFTGDIFENLLNQESVLQDPVGIRNDLRQNFAITERSTGELYRFGFPGPEIFETEYEEILNKIAHYKKAEFLVGSGSLAPGIPDDFYARVAAKAKKNGTRFVLDTSGAAYSGVLEEGAYLLKPNKAELEDLVGVSAKNVEELKELLLGVLNKYDVKILVLSMGAEGALLAYKGKVRHFPAPVVEHVSSIGAGDSMVAGMVYSLSQGKTVENSVRYGIACGSATIKSPGTELLKKEDVEPLYQGLLDKHF